MWELRFDGATVRRVSAAVSSLAEPLPHDARSLLGLLSRWGRETVLDRLALEPNREAAEKAKGVLSRLLKDGIPYTVTMLAVSGRDLLSLGIPAGKRVGELLSEVLRAVMDGQIRNDRKELLEYIGQIQTNDKAQNG